MSDDSEDQSYCAACGSYNLTCTHGRPTASPPPRPYVVSKASTAGILTRLSVWLDEPADTRDLTAHLLYRVGKVSAEAGEVQDALEGYLGWNPRKGKTHEFDDVRKELLDVATAALCAYEHTTGNDGTCMDALEDHIRSVAERAGLLKPIGVSE